MSPKRDKTVRQLVEKYRSQYVGLERPLLRKLIRLENRETFIPESAKLKTLDRELKRSFKLTPYTLLPLSLNLQIERQNILGDPALYKYEDALQLCFDLELGRLKKTRKPIDTSEIIRQSKKVIDELAEAHKIIQGVVGEQRKLP